MQQLLKFIPVTVLHHLADKPKEEREMLPQVQTFVTPVLVAEIKRFYEQSPTTMAKGGSQSATKGRFKHDQQLSSGTHVSEQLFNE